MRPENDFRISKSVLLSFFLLRTLPPVVSNLCPKAVRRKRKKKKKKIRLLFDPCSINADVGGSPSMWSQNIKKLDLKLT